VIAHTDAVAAFTMRLPPDWLVLDVEGERIPVAVNRLLAQAEARDPAVAAHRGQLERRIRSVLRGAREQRVGFCAMLVAWVDGLPVTADLTVGVRDAAGDDAAVIAAQLRGRMRAEVSVLDGLEIGPVVRAKFRQRAGESSARQPAEAAVWQYFIPEPDGRKVAVLTAASSVLALEDEFGDYFDAIVASFSFEPATRRFGGDHELD
jgi:hypothetical protein